MMLTKGKGFDNKRMHNNLINDQMCFTLNPNNNSKVLRQKITELLNNPDDHALTVQEVSDFVNTITSFNNEMNEFFKSDQTYTPNIREQTKSCQNLQLDLRYLVHLYFSKNFFDEKVGPHGNEPDLSRPKFANLNNAMLKLFSDAGKILNILDNSVKMTPDDVNDTEKLNFYNKQIKSTLSEEELAEQLFYSAVHNQALDSISNSLLKEASKDKSLIDNCIFKKYFNQTFFVTNKDILDSNEDVAVNILKRYKEHYTVHECDNDLAGFQNFVNNFNKLTLKNVSFNRKNCDFNSSFDNLKKKNNDSLQHFLQFITSGYLAVNSKDNTDCLVKKITDCSKNLLIKTDANIAADNTLKDAFYNDNNGSWFEKYKLMDLSLIYYTDAYDFFNSEIKGQLKVMLLPEEISIINIITKNILSKNSSQATAILNADVDEQLTANIARIKQRSSFAKWLNDVDSNHESDFFKQCSCDANELKDLRTYRALIDYIYYRAFLQSEEAINYYLKQKSAQLTSAINNVPIHNAGADTPTNPPPIITPPIITQPPIVTPTIVNPPHNPTQQQHNATLFVENVDNINILGLNQGTGNAIDNTGTGAAGTGVGADMAGTGAGGGMAGTGAGAGAGGDGNQALHNQQHNAPLIVQNIDDLNIQGINPGAGGVGAGAGMAGAGAGMAGAGAGMAGTGAGAGAGGDGNQQNLNDNNANDYTDEQYNEKLKEICKSIKDIKYLGKVLKKEVDKITTDIDSYTKRLRRKKQDPLSPYDKNDMEKFRSRYKQSKGKSKKKLFRKIKSYRDIAKFVKNGNIQSLNYNNGRFY